MSLPPLMKFLFRKHLDGAECLATCCTDHLSLLEHRNVFQAVFPVFEKFQQQPKFHALHRRMFVRMRQSYRDEIAELIRSCLEKGIDPKPFEELREKLHLSDSRALSSIFMEGLFQIFCVLSEDSFFFPPHFRGEWFIAFFYARTWRDTRNPETETSLPAFPYDPFWNGPRLGSIVEKLGLCGRLEEAIDVCRCHRCDHTFLLHSLKAYAGSEFFDLERAYRVVTAHIGDSAARKEAFQILLEHGLLDQKFPIDLALKMEEEVEEEKRRAVRESILWGWAQQDDFDWARACRLIRQWAPIQGSVLQDGLLSSVLKGYAKNREFTLERAEEISEKICSSDRRSEALQYVVFDLLEEEDFNLAFILGLTEKIARAFRSRMIVLTILKLNERGDLEDSIPLVDRIPIENLSQRKEAILDIVQTLVARKPFDWGAVQQIFHWGALRRLLDRDPQFKCALFTRILTTYATNQPFFLPMFLLIASSLSDDEKTKIFEEIATWLSNGGARGVARRIAHAIPDEEVREEVLEVLANLNI